MSALVRQPAPELRRFNRKEYHRLIEAGVITEDERLELLEGMIMRMSPQGARHAAAVALVDTALRDLVGSGVHLRIQLPLAVSQDSEPEPDVAVVAGSPREYVDAHPGRALLVVEVADESLETDRGLKASLYAGAGVTEYWIVNLRARELEVYRTPVPSSAERAPFYRERTVLTGSDQVHPSFAPDRSLPVAGLLP